MARKAATPSPPPLAWSSTFHLSSSPPPPSLTGDKLLLPQTALETLLEAASRSAANIRQPVNYDPASWEYTPPHEALFKQNEARQQLPHPLVFRVTNLVNGRTAYAGIREFSADEGQVVLSNYLREGLALPSLETQAEVYGLAGSGDASFKVEAVNIPKGTFARLRPLDVGVEEDWKPILENHLQKNFTTLVVNNILTVSVGGNDVKFLIDQVKPEGTEAICVIDTDLEVDIEHLNEAQARESLRQRELRKKAEASSGGQINIDSPKEGTISDGNLVRFHLKAWDRSKPISINVPEENVDVLVSTDSIVGFPKLEVWTWARFEGSKPIVILPNDPAITSAKELRITLQVYEQGIVDSNSKKPMPGPSGFSFSITQSTHQDNEDEEMADVNPDNEICSNCKRSIPKRSMMLHQNFCFRNNILCPDGCGQVFKRGTESDHWHCTECKAFGLNTPDRNTYNKHMDIAHTARKCDSCGYSAGSVPELANHKTVTCPNKLILCRFCHLSVPQEEDTTFTAAITGLTPHENNCGSRTAHCHICERIVQLKNMEVHLKNHDIERKSQPLPMICRNVNCARTREGGNQTENRMGLCTVCYGPLYNSTYDPNHQQLSRRVELRYLTQLLKGCGKKWCVNEMCKTGRANMSPPLAALSPKEATPIVKSFVTVEGLLGGYTSHPLHFCVDESVAKRKHLIEMLGYAEDQQQGGWAVEWRTKAVEAVSPEAADELDTLNRAREWLEKFAVRMNE